MPTVARFNLDEKVCSLHLRSIKSTRNYLYFHAINITKVLKSLRKIITIVFMLIGTH